MKTFVGALLVVALSAAAAAQQPAPTTVILVRHAEAQANAGTDPALTEAGVARAAALCDALKDAQVKAVITTQYQRTIRTGEPLAAAVKAEAVQAQTAGPLDAHVQAIVQMVRSKYAGATIVIVGHSNTVPALVKALTGVDPGEIAHDAYDNMYIVTTTAPGTGQLVRAKYGAR
jgi:broad specificity phosphatase PhoE